MSDERISPGVRRASAPPTGAVAFAAALGVYLGSVALLGSFTTPADAYFPDLAAASVRGRLDLADPVSTHDLTPFAGRWYVPFPPLPALLVVPLALLAPGSRRSPSARRSVRPTWRWSRWRWTASRGGAGCRSTEPRSPG